MESLTRRSFLRRSATAAAGALALPRFSIGKPGPSANSRLNLAHIGSGSIAQMAYSDTQEENTVALCDVDATKLAWAKEKFPQLSGAREFADFRVMLDKMGKEIDAVCVSTPDHTHFVATMTAMELGKHVCTQKPLTFTLWESRALRKAARETGLITNMGNQGHTYDGIRQAREWLEYGLIGDVHTVQSWIWGPNWEGGYFGKPESYPPEPQPVPATLDWDLWLGPLTRKLEYSPYFHPRKWRGFWDTGTGMLGDWFCHVADGPVWALELFDPEYVELITKGGRNLPGIVPDRTVVKWHFPARNGKPPCDLFWHDGGLRPSPPPNWSHDGAPAGGSFWCGSKNALYLDVRSDHPRLVDSEEMREFKKAGFPPEKYPRVKADGPHGEWVAAIKGDGPLPGSSFEYASRLTEVALLGVLAQRFEGRIEWDAKEGRITNRPELNAYVRQPVRPGWQIGERYSLAQED